MNFRKKPVEVISEPQYVPFRVGLPKACSPKHMEFLIVGKNQGDNQNRLLQVFAIHSARLISNFSCAGDDDHAIFYMSCVVDCSETNCNADNLLIAIRKLKFVVRAEKQSMKDNLFSNFIFPVSLVKTKAKSIIIDANTLFEIIGSSSKVQEIGRKYALCVVETLRSPMSVIQSETRQSARGALVLSVKNYFRVCGWGQLSFDYENTSELFDVSTVVISKLPELDVSQQEMEGPDGLSAPWIGFLRGFVSGLLEAITPESYDNKIVGQTFNKHDRTLTFMVSRETQLNEPEILVVQEASSNPIQQALEVCTEPHSDTVEEGSSVSSQPPEPPSLTVPPNVAERRPSASHERTPVENSQEKTNEIVQETVRSILVAAKNGSNLINIMQKAKLSYSRTRQYIELLTSLEMLESKISDDGMNVASIRTTARGIDYASSYETNTGIQLLYPVKIPKKSMNLNLAQTKDSDSESF